MEKRAVLEVRRQAFHMALGLSLVFLVSQELVGWEGLAGLLAMGMLISLLSRKRRVPVIAWFLQRFEREEVAGVMPGKGALFFMLGVLVVVVAFEQRIALAAIMVLTLGDSISHLFGRFFGRIPHPWNRYKLVEGTLLGFVAGAAGAAAFVPPAAAMAGAGAAMAVEGIELKFRENVVDDNLVIPVVAAVVMKFVIG